jgi:LacI family transcriptional regulator
MARTVQLILNRQRTNLILGHVTSAEDLPPAVLAGQVDGVLGYGEFPAAAISDHLTKVPAVWMMSPSRDVPDLWGDRVMPDHQRIGQLAATYLIDRGHQRVAFLGGGCASPFIRLRGAAFADAAKDRAQSVHVLNAEELPGQPHVREMELVVEQWSKIKPRPTGLFAPTDGLAVWAYQHLQRLGVRPGIDVEIISCDRQEEHLSLLHPRPVSIDPGRETIARLAVERLLYRMHEGMDSSPPVRIVVSPTLDERAPDGVAAASIN